MNVKKILTLVVLTAFGLSSHAQIVSSESENVYRIKTKKPKTFIFYVKAGIGSELTEADASANHPTEYSENSFTAEADFGFKHNIGGKDFYWGAEAGIMSSQYLHYDGDHVETENSLPLAITPLIGYDFKVGESTTISPFIGPSIGIIGFDDGFYGVSVGANIWFNKKWAIGLNYKWDHAFDTHNLTHNRFMLTGIIKL